MSKKTLPLRYVDELKPGDVIKELKSPLIIVERDEPQRLTVSKRIFDQEFSLGKLRDAIFESLDDYAFLSGDLRFFQVSVQPDAISLGVSVRLSGMERS